MEFGERRAGRCLYMMGNERHPPILLFDVLLPDSSFFFHLVRRCSVVLSCTLCFYSALSRSLFKVLATDIVIMRYEGAKA